MSFRWLTASRASAILLALVLIVGAGNLLATRAEVNSAQRAQQREEAATARQGQVILHKLCITLDRLASQQPPPGNPDLNPSRAYLQGQHRVLSELGPDIGCGHTAHKP